MEIDPPADKALPKLSEKFSTNPFLSELHVRGRQKMSILHAPTDNKAIAHATTDDGADASVVFARRDTVDEEQFVKLYTTHMRAWLDLTKTGQKVLVAVLYAVQHFALGKDQIYLSMSDIEDRVGLKKDAAEKGLRELYARKLIAPSAKAPNFYYFNPAYVFNGDRFAFFQEVRVDRKKKKTDDPTQRTFDLDTGKIQTAD